VKQERGKDVARIVHFSITSKRFKRASPVDATALLLLLFFEVLPLLLLLKTPQAVFGRGITYLLH
jgi:hypothetical protein